MHQLFQVIQTQVDKLTQAMSDVKRRQFVYADSKKKCSADLAAVTHRLIEAVKGRQGQLKTQIADTQMPLKEVLQKRGRDLEDWQSLAAGNKSLVADMLLSANDANVLRVSGSLATRAARLAADVTQAMAEATDQRVVLDVDQYDVLKVEELLRHLGSVSTAEPEQVGYI